VVAALNGVTCGAGAVLAAAADVRVASEEARIAFLFTKVGLSGADMGAAWLLPRIVGLGHASELLMLGEFIDARRAHAIGLYNAVVPAAELAARAREWARKLADGPGMGLAVTKRMLNREASMSLAEAMQAEGWIQAECMLHPDYREAYEAMNSKRKPDFAGR
jgi:enoyl-CoA hydratase/carnithine racemase